MKLKFIFFTAFLFLTTIVLAGPADSLKIIEVETLKIVAQEFDTWKWVYRILLPTIVVLGGAIGLRHWLKTKVDDWVNAKIAKTADIKIEDLQTFFADLKKEKAIKASRVCVINKTKGKYLEINREIEKAGFKTDDYRKLDNLLDIDNSKFDVIVLDNSGNAFTEKEVIKFFDDYIHKTKIVYFADASLSDENFSKYKSNVKILKLINYLGDNIRAALS
jgi:hypothetical protein